MTAWIMILFLQGNTQITVPGIQSKQECERIGALIRKETGGSPVKCIQYKMATPPRRV